MDQNLDLGQHFMIDEELLDYIINKSNISSEDIILEIGSGEGALSTKILEKNPQELICVEIDSRCSVPPGARIIRGNILDHIQNISCDKIIANIPYHISQPLFSKISLQRYQRVVCVVGKSFAQELEKNSIIGSVIQSIYSLSLDRIIGPEAFSPPPNVDSALIILSLKEQSLADEVLSKWYMYTASKVKNFLLKACEGKICKNDVRERLKDLDAIIQEKELYTLSSQEFLIIRDFIYNKLF